MRTRARSGYLFFVATAALAGCAGLIGIDDRTLEPSDGSVSPPEAGGGDGGSSDAALLEDGASEVGSDAQLANDAYATGDTADALGGPDAQADRTVQGGPDATAGDAGGAGDARTNGDAPGGGDAQATGDAQQGSDAAGGGEAGGDAQSVAPSCPDPCPLQKGLNHPYFITSDANRVYWTEFGDDLGTANGAVKSCPVTGCGAGPTVYTSSQINPRGIAVDSQNVYWGSASYGFVVGAIWSCPIGGCTSPTKLASADIPFGVAVDATYVYWADNDDNTVHRVAKTNGTDTVLYDAGSSVFIAAAQCSVDNAFVYVSDRNNTVARVPVTGGEPVVITSGPRPGYFGITNDTTSVYFGEAGQIFAASKTSTDGGVALASNVPWPVGLARDTSTGALYWADYGSGVVNDGTVGRVGIDGGGETVLASSLTSPQGVTVSGSSVFWISWGTLDNSPTSNTGALPSTGALIRTSK